MSEHDLWFHGMDWHSTEGRGRFDVAPRGDDPFTLKDHLPADYGLLNPRGYEPTYEHQDPPYRLRGEESGKWYHNSPKEYQPGDRITPPKGPSQAHPEWYTNDLKNRRNYVWLSPNQDSAQRWSDWTGGANSHTYEVHPGDRPQAWNYDVNQGYVAPHAIVKKVLSRYHWGTGRYAANVTVFSKPSCPQCMATHRHLKKNGIPFNSVDLSQDPAALEHVKSLGYTSAPVVQLDEGNHWSGYRPDQLDALAMQKVGMAEYDEYAGHHAAPGPGTGFPIHDMHGEDYGGGLGGVPTDWQTHPQYYDSGEVSPRDTKNVQKMYNRVNGNPEAPVDMYRALPHGNTKFNTGDWVTPSLAYARQHAMHATDPSQDWPVIKSTVPAKHLWQNGDSYYEMGYHGPGHEGQVV